MSKKAHLAKSNSWGDSAVHLQRAARTPGTWGNGYLGPGQCITVSTVNTIACLDHCIYILSSRHLETGPFGILVSFFPGKLASGRLEDEPQLLHCSQSHNDTHHLSSTIYPSSPRVNTFAGKSGSFCEATQTLIPEGSESPVIMSFLICDSSIDCLTLSAKLNLLTFPTFSLLPRPPL